MNPIPRIAFVVRYPNAFTDRLMRGMSRAASELKLRETPIELRDFELQDDSQDLPVGYADWSPDAALVFLGSDREPIHDALRLDTNLPLIHNAGVTKHAGEASVLNEAKGVIDVAWKHFRSIGRERVAGLFHGDAPHMHRMMDGYRQRCKEKGLACEIIHCPDDFFEDYADPQTTLSTTGPAAELLKNLNDPIGIFTLNAFVGAHFCRLCKQMEVSVPEQVAVIGSDGFDVSLWSDPPVTSFRNNLEQVGEASVHLALRLINGEPAPKQTLRIGGAQLVIRGSTVSREERGLDIASAVRFINEHALEGITMLDVVEHTQGVSRQTFVKHFKNWTGMTPTEAIRQRKLDESRRMLRDTQMSVTALSRACGFCDDIEFRKVFNKAEGCSPTEFRKIRSGLSNLRR